MESTRVSTLELFFDLVFVFTITQLTSVLVHDASWKALFQVTLMLSIIFWMYGGYAWLTNAVAPDRNVRRLVLLGGMAGFLVIALAVPDAFSGSGATFGIAYVFVVAIHLTMFTRSTRMSVLQALRALAPFNISTAVMVLVGGILGGDAQYVLWSAAVLAEWISPNLIDSEGFVIEASHFVERHGLVLIVAIGESVVAVGIGAAELPVNAELILATVLGLALSAALWWSYFGTDEGAAEEAMVSAEVSARPMLAIHAFGYAYLALLLGVIAIAAGLKTATGHAFDTLPQAKAIALGGGAAVFLLGEAWHRRSLGLGAAPGRAITAALCLATIPLGTEISAAALIGALVALFAVMLGASARMSVDATRSAALSLPPSRD
jgi:low temperature requirement protein LtrA